jgi:hypothetical protein
MASGEQQPRQEQYQQEQQDDNENDNDDTLSIVFLDMDGVLLPFQQANIPRRTVEALACILGQVPSARLVLSSTWRVQEKYIQIVLDELHRYGYETMDGSSGGRGLMDIDFYDITDPDLHSERQHEIYEWLQRHQRRFARQQQQQQHHHTGGKETEEEEDGEGDFYRPCCSEKANGTLPQRNNKTIKQHVAAWVALDDEELLDGDVNAQHCQFFQGHVVKTDSHAGLTMDDAKRAIALLQGQLKK